MTFEKELKIIIDILFNNETELPDFSSIDHAKFLKLLIEHRVLLHVFESKQIKDNKAYLNFIEPYAQDYKLKILFDLNALSNLNDLLTKNRIDFVLLKGHGLSQLLYNDPGYRMSKDIDILIDLENLDNIDKVLIESGFQRLTFFNSPKQKATLIKHFEHIQYLSKDGRINLEVHWRIEDHFLNDFKEKLSQVEIGGKKYTILGQPFRWKYIFKHALEHDFFRLHWLYDIFQAEAKSYVSWKDVLSQEDELIYQQIISGLQNDNSQGNDKRAMYCIRLLKDKHCLRIASQSFKDRKYRFFERIRHNWVIGGVNQVLKGLFKRNIRPENWKFYAFPDSMFFLNHLLSRPIWLIKQMVSK